MRTRDLGITIGEGTPGPLNAITDVPGVLVGHTTLIAGEGPLVVGQGPVRTGVTVVIPHDGDVWSEPVFAGCHRLNGNGDLTGIEWIRETGLLAGAVAITNTSSVGVVRDALVSHAARSHQAGGSFWTLPVVGETYDGDLNDINGFHVRPGHVDAAIASAAGGPVAEGCVGGGTGMICHDFKAGIGTASREVAAERGGWIVGVLVQANYGRRSWLRVDGVPVGREIGLAEVPGLRERIGGIGDAGSIIGLVATDAPLLPHQCERLAQRVGLGMARVGGTGANSSGDLFLAFSTGNRGLPLSGAGDPRRVLDLRMVPEDAMSPLFEAVVEASEEAIVNALVAAETMVGRDGLTSHAIPHDRLREVMARYGRVPATR